MVFRVKKVHVAKRVVKEMPDQLENVVEKVIGVIKVNKVKKNKIKWLNTIIEKFYNENTTL